jgi:hypothetical protein
MRRRCRKGCGRLSATGPIFTCIMCARASAALGDLCTGCVHGAYSQGPPPPTPRETKNAICKSPQESHAYLCHSPPARHRVHGWVT